MKVDMTPDFPSAALAAGHAGFHVFPLKPSRKYPLRKNWQASATTDLLTIESTWRDNPLANVGIATGRGLVVLDSDSKTGDDALRELGLPSTTTVKTARGHHFYFEGKARSRAGILPSVDVRGAGGLVVGAGSLHPSGSLYEYDIPPHELPPQPLPTAFEELFGSLQGAEAPPSVTSYPLFGVIPEGQRNATLFRYARKLAIHVGANQEELMPMLAHLNESRCAPPLSATELCAIVKSAIGYEFAPWTMDPVAYAHEDSRLSSTDRHLLIALASYANPRGECWPSIDLLSRCTGMKSDTVEKAINRLVTAGRITVNRGSRGRSNRYQLIDMERKTC